MANSTTHVLPYPIRKARWTIPVPYLDADGDPTDPTTPDTEVSKDGAAFADCAEEVTTISGSNGAGYITLSGAETDCALLAVCAKVASGPKATLFFGQPRNFPIIFSGTATAGASGTITLDSSAPAITSALVGCIIRTTGGTGGGGTGGANNQARVITAYTSGRVATVGESWETTPDATTTYDILLTPEALLRYGDLRLLEGAALGTHTAGYVPADSRYQSGTSLTARDIGASVLLSSGTGTGQVKLSGGYVAPNWGDVGNPTTTVTLANTSIATAIGLEATLVDIDSRIPLALVGGYMPAQVMGLQSAAEDQVAIAVWSELTTRGNGYLVDYPGSFGALLVSYVDYSLSDLSAQVADKTGYKLASDGLDSISTTAPSGVASNFREMIVQLWRRMFKKSTLTSSQLKTYADDGTTVATTQAVSDDGVTQTQGSAT